MVEDHVETFLDVARNLSQAASDAKGVVEYKLLQLKEKVEEFGKE